MLKPQRKYFIAIASILMMLVWSGCRKDDPSEETAIPEVSDISNTMNRGFVYTCNKTGGFEVWKNENSTAAQITESNTHDSWWPRYCLATDRILFYRSTSGRDINDFEHAELWVMDSDGSNAEPLITSNEHGWDKQGLADWSPDGNQIIMSAIDPEIGTWQLYLTDAEGELIQRVSTRDAVHYIDPVFSADGSALFYVSCPEGSENIDQNFEIFRLDLISQTEERLTFNQIADHHPHPSPDGKYVAYESLTDPNYLAIGKWVIHQLNLETAEEQTLLDDDNINLFPRYSNDGDQIYFSSLNIETFGMRIASHNFGTQETVYLVDEYYSALNVDPF